MVKFRTKKLAALICTLAVLSSGILPAAAATSFPDVPASHWAYSYVSSAVEEGLVRGFPDGSFHPNDAVTYAQFITIVAQAYYIIPEGTSSNPWYQVYVDILNQDDLLAGTKAESAIGSPISRFEMAQIVHNVLNNSGITAGADQLKKAQEKFSDWSSVPKQYRDAVALCYGNGVLSGLPGGIFGGDQTMTRAQACSVIIRVIDLLKKNTTPDSQPDTGDFTPVPMDQLANRKSLQKKATDDQLAQAYAEALKIVTPLANLSREQQLQGIAKALRARFDAGMEYSMSSAHYNDPYGYLIEGSASCAGCTRATGLCLNILGIEYEHVNEGAYSHQWCRVNLNGTYWICDAYGLYVGPEPAPYKHPYF